MPGPWYTTFNAQFWMVLAGMVFAFLGVIAKSKCKKCSFCGVYIERDIKAELAAETQKEKEPARQESIPPSPLAQNSFNQTGESFRMSRDRSENSNAV